MGGFGKMPMGGGYGKMPYGGMMYGGQTMTPFYGGSGWSMGRSATGFEQ